MAKEIKLSDKATPASGDVAQESNGCGRRCGHRCGQRCGHRCGHRCSRRCGRR